MSDCCESLVFAAAGGHLACVKHHFSREGCSDGCPLERAAAEGHIGCLRWLLDQNYNSGDHSDALIQAVEYDRLECTLEILRREVVVDGYVLRAAIMYYSTSCLSVLLSRMDEDTTRAAIIYSVEFGSPECGLQLEDYELVHQMQWSSSVVRNHWAKHGVILDSDCCVAPGCTADTGEDCWHRDLYVMYLIDDLELSSEAAKLVASFV